MKVPSKYEELLKKLVYNGEANVALIDCDAQFFIEDALKEINVKYNKIIPDSNRYRVEKSLIYKIR